MLSYPYMVNAFEAGTVVAVLAGVVGWFMVLRREAFLGHTLAVIGFPGAAAATLIGASAGLGFFVSCGLAAVALASGSPSRRGEGDRSAAIGILQAFALASGFLFASLYHGNVATTDTLLFGTFLGITVAQVRVLLTVAVVALAAMAAVGRPLLFASVDPDVAAARGVPTHRLTVAFLLILGATAAETSQITGSLLVFALLVLPAATAQSLTTRPGRGIALTVAIGVAVTWSGLIAAFSSPWPIGFWVTTFAFVVFVAARRGLAVRGRRLPVAA